jgi:hypothetical protein
VTYTQSGTYTVVNGCATEVLALTILTGGTNTTTETACDSYTWGVNNVTYTESGTYTVVTGCSTEILVLTITPSTINTSAESACSSYTWSVNGQTYTQSGTYTSVNGCATEILVLTVSIPGTACDDGDPGTGNDVLDANCECAGQVIDCEGVPGGSALPGTPCDDGIIGTINDTWTNDCQCQGTPTNCTENITLNITVDAFGSQTTWTIFEAGTNNVVTQGGPYPDGIAGSVIIEQRCVPAGCYRLVVSDAAGDGISGGGYVLRTGGSNGQRIIDNSNNGGFASTSAIIGGGGFCLPLGTDRLIFTRCDKLDYTSSDYIVAVENPAVSALWVPGAPDQQQSANTGYQFWIFDPNGSYGYAKFRGHNTSDLFGPPSATRACHLLVNNWSPNQIPENVLMNVRVRSRVNGVNSAWGPTCRIKLNAAQAACPLTKLMDIPWNPFFSCNVVRTWGGSSRVYARPVTGATQYQFRFSSAELASPVVRTNSTYYVNLNWSPALPNGVYEVQVRAFKNGQWCVTSLPWGDVCNVTITGSPASMGLSGDGAVSSTEEVRLNLFPNPSNGNQLNVSLSAVEEGVEVISMDIFDLSGARVRSEVLPVNDGMIYQQMAVSDLASGLYMVNVTAGGRRYTERLVIAR